MSSPVVSPDFIYLLTFLNFIALTGGTILFLIFCEQICYHLTVCEMLSNCICALSTLKIWVKAKIVSNLQ